MTQARACVSNGTDGVVSARWKAGGMNKPEGRWGGFSLVEVVLALAMVAAMAVVCVQLWADRPTVETSDVAIAELRVRWRVLWRQEDWLKRMDRLSGGGELPFYLWEEAGACFGGSEAACRAAVAPERIWLIECRAEAAADWAGDAVVWRGLQIQVRGPLQLRPGESPTQGLLRLSQQAPVRQWYEGILREGRGGYL